jgi:FtsH-binding integral membrane protein
MTKEDYKVMFQDGLFWCVLMFALLCFIAVVPLAAIVALLLGIMAVTFVIMSVVAYKMYKKNRYWHYKKED